MLLLKQYVQACLFRTALLVNMYLMLLSTVLHNNVLFVYHLEQRRFVILAQNIEAVIQVGYKNELPEFASVAKLIVVSPSKIYFVLMETRGFSSHFHASDVGFPTMPRTFILLQSEFTMYFPTHCTKASNTTSGSYVVTKYNGPKIYV